MCFEGQIKQSKIRSVMKWWSKCLSMDIAKTASRNVAFKATKRSDSTLAGQPAVIMREIEGDASFDGAVLGDLDCNAGLYIFKQDAVQD